MSEKNLLVVCNNFPNRNDSIIGGIFIKEQVKHISHFFNNVYVVSPIAYGMGRLRGIGQFDYQFDNVHVYFPKYFNNPLFWNKGRPMWVNLETRAIESLIKKEKLCFDLIHAHFTWPSGAVAVRLKQIHSSPVIITEHTSTTFQKAVETQDPVFIEAWREADSLVRVRRNDVALFERVGISLGKVTSIPNGYDSERFYPSDALNCRATLNLPLDKKIILYVGNFYSEAKGHKYLIDAISIIVKQRKDVLCIIIGSGKLQTDIEKQIKSLDLDDFVYLPGRKSHGEIPIWMNACDIFVLPSLSESFGVVQLEAMACGKPVVATRNGGSEEIITSSVHGILVEPSDPGSLADGIMAALDQEWNHDAILQYAKQYTWADIAKNIADLYKKSIV